LQEELTSEQKQGIGEIPIFYEKPHFFKSSMTRALTPPLPAGSVIFGNKIVPSILIRDVNILLFLCE
jgi:hypothetical protein